MDINYKDLITHHGDVPLKIQLLNKVFVQNSLSKVDAECHIQSWFLELNFLN